MHFKQQATLEVKEIKSTLKLHQRILLRSLVLKITTSFNLQHNVIKTMYKTSHHLKDGKRT
uniref:Putative ovule protein n=1 Tax=Solanum chacoense TaxID=4108 RepID=A0A0V0H452_SOLCH